MHPPDFFDTKGRIARAPSPEYLLIKNSLSSSPVINLLARKICIFPMKSMSLLFRTASLQMPRSQHIRSMCGSVVGSDYRRMKFKLMRGGTSKGLFFLRSWLPEVDADAAFAAAMGSRDRFNRQLDGMGGGTSSTSKVAVVDALKMGGHAPAGGVGGGDWAGCDVSYMFGQVSVADETVDYSGTCGNLASAVGNTP